MSLRRTALARRSELKRTPLTRRAPMPRSGTRDTRRMRRTSIALGPSTAQRSVVLDRADGCCELCGRRLHDGTTWLSDHSMHHRQPRGMGGSKLDAVHAPFQLLLLCGTGTTGCHGWVEAHRADAIELGLLVPHGVDPAVTPVLLRAPSWRGIAQSVLLTENGDYLPVEDA